MSINSFISFERYFRRNKRKGVYVLKHWIIYLWNTRFHYLNYLLSKLGLKLKFSVNADILSNPGAPSLLFNWGVHVMINRYKSAFEKNV